MKEQIRKILANKYVDNFLIALILLNFLIFIFQTDAIFYNRFKDYINNFEFYSIIIFTFEYFLRVISLEKLKDIFKPMMIVDFLAVFPYYMSFVTVNTIFLRVLRVFRLFRVAKLARYTKALERMKNAFFKHRDEIIVTAIIFIIGLTVTSIAIYFAEHQTGNSAFESIPKSFWWSVVTFTSWVMVIHIRLQLWVNLLVPLRQ